jgi:hypothetical protein
MKDTHGTMELLSLVTKIAVGIQTGNRVINVIRIKIMEIHRLTDADGYTEDNVIP